MGKENLSKKHATHAFSQFKLTNYLLNNLSQFEITPTAKLVLLELSACYNPNKADMFPKQKTLAAKIGVSERSIVRAIQELFKAGLIIIECKYTNRYKFTSKIVCECPQNEKFFTSENMSDNLRQNATIKDDNLSQHEPTIKQIKEPEKVEDFKILTNYAKQKGAQNLTAYVNALKKNGSAEQIIKAFKEKKAADKYFARQIRETEKRNAQNRIWIADNPNECGAIKEVLLKNWGIKK